MIIQKETAAESSTVATDAQNVEEGSLNTVSSWLEHAGDQLFDLAVAYAPRVILALVILFIGWLVIRFLRRGTTRVLSNKRFDPSISSFFASVIGVSLWVMLGLSVAGLVGIPVTSFVAIATAATFAIGMALKGTLQNFAAGVLILMKRPFHVGDFIECSGTSGTVKEIRFFDTLVTTGDNTTIIIPNNDLATKVVTNFSTQSTRRMQSIIGIGYDDDIDKARDVIQSLLDAEDRVHKDPAPTIVVSELADSSVNLQVRAWMNSGDLSKVTWKFNEDVKKAFDREGISIPYPQMDVHTTAAS